MARTYTFEEWLKANPELFRTVTECDECEDGLIECPSCHALKIEGLPCGDCNEVGWIDCQCVARLKVEYECRLHEEIVKYEHAMRLVA